MKKKSINTRPPQYLAKILLGLILGTLLTLGYFVFFKQAPEISKEQTTKKQTHYFEEPIDADLENITDVKEIPKTITEEETEKKSAMKQKNEPTQEKVNAKTKDETKTKQLQNGKLVIIIDDITTSSQVEKLKEMGYIINLSFLPPTKTHPESAQIAQDLKSSMIHLPLQATNFPHEEEETLKVDDSYEVIEKKISSIKNLYPKAKFINNHTGSKFSENEEACDNLMKAISKHGFAFVDSKTSSKSVLCKSAKKYGVECYERNIFLDNEQNEEYIANQLQKAIKLAQNKGFAIAIGHPHKETFRVLSNSKNEFSELKTVYIDKL